MSRLDLQQCRTLRPARAKQLWELGLATPQIAARMGVSRASVNRYLTVAGVVRNGTRRVEVALMDGGACRHTAARPTLDHLR